MPPTTLNSEEPLKRISSCVAYIDIGRMFEPDASSISNRTRVSPGSGLSLSMNICATLGFVVVENNAGLR